MPKLYDKSKILTINLDNINNTSLVWLAENKKDKNINENPLVLDFYGQDFYFYSKGIKTISSNEEKENKFVIDVLFLTFFQQEKLASNFFNFYNKSDILQNIVLLKLKKQLLLNKIAEIYNQITELKNIDKYLLRKETHIFILMREKWSNIDKKYCKEKRLVNIINKKYTFKYNMYSKLYTKISNNNMNFQKCYNSSFLSSITNIDNQLKDLLLFQREIYQYFSDYKNYNSIGWLNYNFISKSHFIDHPIDLSTKKI